MSASKKCIVTTTINPPSTATMKFCEKKGWNFIIVGDTKTPHEKYQELEKKYPHVTYMTPEIQEKKYKKLSDFLGWRTIERRNVGFVEAYNMGAEIIATVDDDNIPYESWGENVLVNKEVSVDMYEPAVNVFDPLSVTDHKFIWHRGYPVELLNERFRVEYKGKVKRKVLVQADLWDGDPDIDAIARLTMKPIVKFSEVTEPFCSNRIAPFDSQNTFVSREAIPYYTMFPFIGRMDDIWGAYVMQHFLPDSVIFNKASVYQDRNVQDLVTNLENEIIGYRHTYKLLNDLPNFENYLPEKAVGFFKLYQSQFKK